MAKIDLEEMKKSQHFPCTGEESCVTYFTYCSSLVKNEGLWLEFGVYEGTSISRLGKLNPNQKIYGFDSFEGLPEEWCGAPQGAYSNNGNIPNIPEKNVEFIKGWFSDTLPKFLETHSELVAFLHIDCDLYSSTKTVFECLGDRIQSGTIILFDEFYGNDAFHAHEMQAFSEYLDKFNKTYEWVAHRGCPCAVRIL